MKEKWSWSVVKCPCWVRAAHAWNMLLQLDSRLSAWMYLKGEITVKSTRQPVNPSTRTSTNIKERRLHFGANHVKSDRDYKRNFWTRKDLERRCLLVSHTKDISLCILINTNKVLLRYKVLRTAELSFFGLPRLSCCNDRETDLPSQRSNFEAISTVLMLQYLANKRTNHYLLERKDGSNAQLSEQKKGKTRASTYREKARTQKLQAYKLGQ